MPHDADVGANLTKPPHRGEALWPSSGNGIVGAAFGALSEADARRRRREFMLNVDPLALRNATRSPVNPIAMF